MEPHPSDPRLDKVCAGKYKYDVPLSYNHHDNGMIPHVSLCRTTDRRYAYCQGNCISCQLR